VVELLFSKLQALAGKNPTAHKVLGRNEDSWELDSMYKFVYILSMF
jgi:hypothetical protein